MVLVPVCLRDVLRTTMACTSSTSQPPKVVTILASKCALRDNDVHFFDISSSKSRMCGAFSILTSKCGSAPAALASLVFDPPEPQNIGKHTVFLRLFYLFAHLDLLSSVFLFSDLLFPPFFFSDSSHLCFSICPYRRKFDFYINFLRLLVTCLEMLRALAMCIDLLKI